MFLLVIGKSSLPLRARVQWSNKRLRIKCASEHAPPPPSLWRSNSARVMTSRAGIILVKRNLLRRTPRIISPCPGVLGMAWSMPNVHGMSCQEDAPAPPRLSSLFRSLFLVMEQISAPIMSRFDLFFVVLDECDETADFNIAQHIIRVHQNKAEVRVSEKNKQKQNVAQVQNIFCPSPVRVNSFVVVVVVSSFFKRKHCVFFNECAEANQPSLPVCSLLFIEIPSCAVCCRSRTAAVPVRLRNY